MSLTAGLTLPGLTSLPVPVMTHLPVKGCAAVTWINRKPLPALVRVPLPLMAPLTVVLTAVLIVPPPAPIVIPRLTFKVGLAVSDKVAPLLMVMLAGVGPVGSAPKFRSAAATNVPATIATLPVKVLVVVLVPRTRLPPP